MELLSEDGNQHNRPREHSRRNRATIDSDDLVGGDVVADCIR
jgi:hypothetical protein